MAHTREWLNKSYLKVFSAQLRASENIKSTYLTFFNFDSNYSLKRINVGKEMLLVGSIHLWNLSKILTTRSQLTTRCARVHFAVTLSKFNSFLRTWIDKSNLTKKWNKRQWKKKILAKRKWQLRIHKLLSESHLCQTNAFILLYLRHNSQPPGHADVMLVL